MTLLSVNVDHVATIRQARGVAYPDPVEAAVLAEDAGASGITVHLRGPKGNAEGIGACMTIESKKEKQMRELRSGSNFLSQNPAEAHFGLGDKRWVKGIHVCWPDGVETLKRFVRAASSLLIQWASSQMTVSGAIWNRSSSAIGRR